MAQDPTSMSNTILFGDCRDSLRQMAAAGIKVQTCVTSPPYFGLRDYNTGTWEGGDPACEHGVKRWEGEKQSQGAQSGHASKADKLARTECRCGARKVDHQLGLEETPEQYIAAMVEVFRAVREVLADDGTLWVNIGDSYSTDGRKGRAHMGEGKNSAYSTWSVRTGPGLKQKDLIGIPWMLAFALRADGWYLRQEIIWHKPNPMPESVTDRCTKAHEYLFLLSKAPRYYFDSEAIKEPSVYADCGRPSKQRGDFDGKNTLPGKEAFRAITETRNKRSVWTIPTKPYKGAHFAVFPPDLIAPCILAGSRPGDTVLDPFMGSGTTAAVSIQHGRQYLGCELNPEYQPLQDQRIAEASAERAERAAAKEAADFLVRQATLFPEDA